MPFVANFPFFTIMLTMAAGVISSVLSGKAAYYLNLAVVSICTLLSGGLLWFFNSNPQTFTYLMGHFSAPWGNEIRFGPLEALIATALSFVMLMVVIGERERVFINVKPKKINLFYLMMNLMLSSLYALIYTNDLFTSYVFIEINTLCACGFIVAKENGKTIAATIKYLIMSLLGSGLFLVSIILMYNLTGHLLMPNVNESMVVLAAAGNYQLPLTIIVGLLAVGIAIKSALFPFHSWMSHAYNNAMNASNAISSGLVVKGYIILLIKIFYRVLGIELVDSLNVSNVLFAFGILAIIVGSVDAVKEDNIKRMLAYSSVGQIGYIYVGIGLENTAGIIAACFIIVAHALVKSMLFLSCEGLMSSSNNGKYIENLAGSGHRNPIAALCFTIGGISLIGVPLFTGFVGKYQLITATSDPTKIWFVLAAIAISTVLNAIYITKFIIHIYKKTQVTYPLAKISGNYKFVMGCFIVVNLALGILYQPVIDTITIGLELL